MLDDCGTFSTSATVLATFSNGDPAVVLPSLGAGVYQATWRPVNPAGSVTVNVTATQPPLTSAQVAGGLRDVASVEAALEAGATRVVLSAATPDEQALVAECVVRWGERVAVALEVRDGRVTVAGWLPSDAATALDVARAMGYLGVETLLFTSATTSGADDPLPARLRRAFPFEIPD